MRKFCYFLGMLLSYIWPAKLHDIIVGINKYIRTGYYSRHLKRKGYNFYLSKDSCVVGPEYISLDDNVEIGKRCVISAWHRDSNASVPSLSISYGTCIGDDCHITASAFISIGKNVLIGKNVTITDNSHGEINKESMLINPTTRRLVSKGGVIINDRVWIGDKATILPGVEIGEGAIIGANTVVSHSVPAYAVVVGSSCRIVKQL